MSTPRCYIVARVCVRVRWESQFLATIGLHKVWFQLATPDMSNRAEAAGDVLVRMGQESYNPQITWPGGDSVPFLLIQYRLH